MARKSRAHLLSITPHEPEPVKPSIKLYCPQLKNGNRDVVYCLYKCPKSRLVKCPAYTQAYPELLSFHIEDKYIEKYGMPTILVPMALRKRRKRRVPEGATEN